jgi:hypothetical protein
MQVTRDDKGELDSYAWPGGYPIFYMTKDNSVLCADCANRKNGSEAILATEPIGEDDFYDPQWTIVAADINYEDDFLYCDHCNAQIESAYGDPDK